METMTFTLPASGDTSDTTPSNSASGPETTFTDCPTSRLDEVFFGASRLVRFMILLYSSRVSGAGLPSAPTNPVTPGVLRTAAQLRSSSSMRTST